MYSIGKLIERRKAIANQKRRVHEELKQSMEATAEVSLSTRPSSPSDKIAYLRFL